MGPWLKPPGQYCDFWCRLGRSVPRRFGRHVRRSDVDRHFCNGFFDRGHRVRALGQYKQQTQPRKEWCHTRDKSGSHMRTCHWHTDTKC